MTKKREVNISRDRRANRLEGTKQQEKSKENIQVDN